MKVVLPLALLLSGAAPVDHPRTYLLSIGHIPLKDTESISAFAIKTWGVEVVSVCHIPTGWEIKAGNRTTPDGDLDGEGSNGVTWFNRSNTQELQNLVLVTMYAPVQRYTIGQRDNGVPATFEGSVTINADDSEISRALSYKNITLKPAQHCPLMRVR